VLYNVFSEWDTEIQCLKYTVSITGITILQTNHLITYNINKKNAFEHNNDNMIRSLANQYERKKYERFRIQNIVHPPEIQFPLLSPVDSLQDPLFFLFLFFLLLQPKQPTMCGGC